MPQKPWVKDLRNPPLQYQRGYTEFYKLSFKVNPHVLIPRPETELLVDEVIKFVHSSQLVSSQKNSSINHEPITNNQLTIIDVGTGSGCIAISVAKNLPNAKVFAVDRSEEALKVAIDNAEINKVSDRVVFLQSDLLSFFTTPPDIIVANLPYIPSARLMLIDPLVRDFEPKMALDGGVDGFDLYRKMFEQIKAKKLYPKILICEIDEEQGETALAEAKQYFPDSEREIKKDLFGRDRILVVKFNL